jgi:predicted transcriptional regulator
VRKYRGYSRLSTFGYGEKSILKKKIKFKSLIIYKVHSYIKLCKAGSEFLKKIFRLRDFTKMWF